MGRALIYQPLTSTKLNLKIKGEQVELETKSKTQPRIQHNPLTHLMTLLDTYLEAITLTMQPEPVQEQSMSAGKIRPDHQPKIIISRRMT